VLYKSFNTLWLYICSAAFSLAKHRLAEIGPKSKISSLKEETEGRLGYKISNESHEANRGVTAEQRDWHILPEVERKEIASCPSKM
jgi:hypothetical protein